MRNILKSGVLTAMAVTLPQALTAQLSDSTVFSDDFQNGSTINGTSSAATVTSDSTSYDFDSTKTGSESISSSGLEYQLSAGTTSGFVEAQAVFTSSPVTLATAGDYIDLTYTFTDTANLLAGGSSSGIFNGLYKSGGYAPVAGTGVSGNAVTLNTTTGSAVASGYAAGWQGYVARIYGNVGGVQGQSEIYTRPPQTSGTTSANQDLVGNGFGSGTYVAEPGSLLGTQTSTAPSGGLTAASQYTIDYRLSLQSGNVVSISENLYAGASATGTPLSSETANDSSGSPTLTFDGMAFGERNSGTSLNPEMTINQITISEGNTPTEVPEPNTFVLFGGGMVLLQGAWRRLQKRA
jgi:hypothetical protein